MSGQILLCSSVLRTCTWKIVFKIENNELNELSECMHYKMFFFFGKHLKTVNLSFTEYFPEALLAYFKVSYLKVYKTSQNFSFLLYLALKVSKTFNQIACLKSFSKPFTNLFL